MAVVRHIRARNVTFGGEPHSGWLPPGAAEPRPTPVEHVTLELTIVQAEPSGFFLEWSGGPGYIGDTWHEALEDAIHQAEFWFGILPEEWHEGAPAAAETRE